jgi:pimeloyl-ACP methyl ester carboxylesterase/heme-degrading monooxygenase HmoA
MTETIFFNLWQTDSREAQESLAAEMRSEATAFLGKRGFLGLSVWTGQDNHRVIVEGRWRSRAHFDAAVSESPQAMAGRARLEKFGKAEPGLFSESFRIEPEASEIASEAPFEAVSTRWAELGLKSRMIGVNGVELHVVSGGTGSPLVLLHGYPQSGEIWRFVAPELTKTHHLIIPDLRGMGLSGIASSGYDLPNVADDLHQLIAYLGLSQVAVAGHDWGGAVGAVWALRHRSDVSKVAFIDSAVAGAGFESIWAFNQPNPAMTFIPFLLGDPLAESLVVGREETFLHHLWNTFTHNKDRVPFASWKPYVEAMKRPGLMRSSASYYRSVYAAVDRVRELIDIGKLTIPVLSISGAASFGEAQKPFVEAFASNIARHVVVPNSGHFIAEEQPEALVNEFRTFFDD